MNESDFISFDQHAVFQIVDSPALALVAAGDVLAPGRLVTADLPVVGLTNVSCYGGWTAGADNYFCGQPNPSTTNAVCFGRSDNLQAYPGGSSNTSNTACLYYFPPSASNTACFRNVDCAINLGC